MIKEYCADTKGIERECASQTRLFTLKNVKIL